MIPLHWPLFASITVITIPYNLYIVSSYILLFPGCERLGIPQNELESVAGEREVWVSLLGLLPLRLSG